MSASTPPNSSAREEAHADLFAELVMQHANMALIFVGAVPHPETGKPVQDLEAAQLFIDRLEMLEAKTRGNLSSQEAALLKQSLAASRMAFVQAVQSDEQAAQAATTMPIPPSEPPLESDKSAAPAEAPSPSAGDAAGPAGDDRKKFVKKY